MSGENEPGWAAHHVFYQGSMDQLLSQLVLPVVRGLWRRRQIDRFFFIRYGLGGPHVRLRFLCAPGDREEVGETVLSAAAEFFRSYPSETRLSDDEIRRQNPSFAANDDTCAADAVFPNHSVAEFPFRPESERYGGPGLLAHSLDFFCASSAYVLRLIAADGVEPRSRRLSWALRTLLRQALGFAADGASLVQLVTYAAMGLRRDPSGKGPPLLDRADQEFERRREDYVGLVHEEIEIARDPEARLLLEGALLTEAARALAWRIRDAALPVWWQIVGSQLHMTANRLDLTSFEEIYLGQILRRALEDAAVAGSGPLPLPGSGDIDFEARVAASFEQLAPPREDDDER